MVSLKGKKVVVTGTMHKPRAEILQELRNIGAIPQASVVRSTDLLIVGANVNDTAKFQKAEMYGVQMLNQQDYLRAIDGDFDESTYVPKMTQAEFIESLPSNYGEW